MNYICYFNTSILAHGINMHRSDGIVLLIVMSLFVFGPLLFKGKFNISRDLWGSSIIPYIVVTISVIDFSFDLNIPDTIGEICFAAVLYPGFVFMNAGFLFFLAAFIIDTLIIFAIIRLVLYIKNRIFSKKNSELKNCMTTCMNKRNMLAVCLIFLLTYTPNVKAVQVLERKIIAEKVTDCDMHKTALFFYDNNILITFEQVLYANNNLVKKSDFCRYCNLLGGVVKNNQFYINSWDGNVLYVYKIKNAVNFINKIEQTKFEISPSYEKVVILPGLSSYYLFGHYEKFPLNPIEYIRTSRGCGEGVYYFKPFLAEVQDDKIIQYIKLPCGENIDESYIVHEAISGESSVHLLGFRNVDVPFIGKSAPVKLVSPNDYCDKIYKFSTGNYYEDRGMKRSVILYYSDYNLKKEKNTRKYKIYENTPGYDEKTDTYCDYGVLSADTKDDNVFAVFSWVKWQKRRAEKFNINNVNSDIYFWQCSDNSYGKPEKIAEGFCPLVRVDQFGIVHVFWLDRSGNIVRKVKKGDKWDNEEIILNDFSTNKSIIYTKGCSIKVEEDRPEAILYTKFLAAEFDSENNLHIVYPAADGIIYTKLKLE